MRFSFFMIAALVLASCGRAEPSEVTLELKQPTRVNGCNVFLHHALGGEPLGADITYVCDVPESFINEKNWWGDGMQPPATGLLLGDCLRLGNRFYCMEKIEPGKAATLKATYEILHDRRIDHLRPIR
ncbi:hypothetical protein [Polyangium jinanense]|uniref:Lipoprotein n=1 Tax=Polyangium jinanense TaxID=2829994 RepID=A0A9X4AZ65_9BACT|nr:hypothetical protein [Polyangium jinanense]MDC3961792.1 hypothetical protein [Polyangium jinanense]MDC3988314.1 hypothetical protein [Polyangium jinanense]MDC3989511.1 hypothetical protein [Polyangium jinanense]